MTPKGQIVGKVYIIETITADKGCEILRGTPIDVKKQASDIICVSSKL